MKIVTWDRRLETPLPAGWEPVPYRLTSGALIACPFDGTQPYIVQPKRVNMQDNMAWARTMQLAYTKFQTDVMTYSPEAATAPMGYRVGQAKDFADAVGQSGRFDYQRPPGTDTFVAYYTSFASYNFGVLGYYAGFTIEHLLEGGGYTNWLHAAWDRMTHWGRTRMDTSGADGTSRLNEWCVRRAFQDAQQKLIA